MGVGGKKPLRVGDSSADPIYAGLLGDLARSKVTLTFTENLFGENTGSVSYEGLDNPYPVLDRKTGSRFNLPMPGVPKFEVESTSFDEQIVRLKDGSLSKFYNVSINLKEDPEETEKKEKLLRNLKSAGGGGSVSDAKKIEYSGSWSYPEVGHNRAEVSFASEDDEVAEGEDAPTAPRTIFTQKDNITIETEEGDLYAHEPPPNTKVLRDTTSNFDESGPKHIHKKTRRVNGQLASEEMTTYGFAYLRNQISPDGETLYDENPARFWQPIEYKKTVYGYRRVSDTALNVRITEPGNSVVLGYIVHPDYTQFASVGFVGGGGITFSSNAEYLVSEVTTGWKLVRLKKEDDQDDSRDLESPYQPFFPFVRVPFYASKSYNLKSARGLFGEQIVPPFRVEFADYNTLELRLKQMVPKQNITDQGKVAILYPDANYIEPMYIEEELYQSNSFIWAVDPEADEVDPENFIPGTNRLVPPSRLMAGEESRTQVKRVLTSQNRYTEYIAEYSSQDPGFDNSAERFSFREVEGRPPEPQHRIQEVEAKEVSPNQLIPNRPKTAKKYYATSRNAGTDDIPEGGSVSIDDETITTSDLKRAEAYLENETLKAFMQASTMTATVAWYKPFSIGAGVGMPRLGGGSAGAAGGGKSKWRVNSWSATFECFGRETVAEGAGLCICRGTQVVAGEDDSVEYNITEEIEPIPADNTNAVEPIVDVSLISRPGQLGRSFPDLSNRRNF